MLKTLKFLWLFLLSCKKGDPIINSKDLLTQEKLINRENYYGSSGAVTIETSSVLDTLINCVFNNLILKNSVGAEITISGQTLDI